MKPAPVWIGSHAQLDRSRYPLQEMRQFAISRVMRSKPEFSWPHSDMTNIGEHR